MNHASFDQMHSISCSGADTREWYAWLDTMPPGPASLHVVGQVQVPNPGVEVILRKTVPQGVNQKILLLDLHLVQKPGIWPQVIVWAPARFDEQPAADTYTNVEILCDGKSVANIDVQIIA